MDINSRTKKANTENVYMRTKDLNDKDVKSSFLFYYHLFYYLLNILLSIYFVCLCVCVCVGVDEFGWISCVCEYNVYEFNVFIAVRSISIRSVL